MALKTKILPRKRIDSKLENIFLYPLSIIHAPIGYGKTTAVSRFLNEKEIDLAWVSLVGSSGSVSYLWEHMADRIIHSNPSLGNALKRLGFPSDAFKTEKMIDLLIDYEFKRPLVLVFDDFQIMNEPSMFSFIKLLAQEKIKSLHVVIITRDLSKTDAAGLYQRQLCFTLTEKSLKFSQDEIQRYFSLMDCELNEQDAEEIYRCTDGWISMVYIIMKGMQRGLPVGRNNTVDDIIEQNLYNPLDEPSRRVLFLLSALNSFTIPMALYVLDDVESAGALQALVRKNTFLVCNEFDKTYKIRNLIQEFFFERARAQDLDFRTLYKRAGEWYLRERQYGRAFEYLYEAGEAEAILAELNRENTPDIQFTQFQQINRIFERLTDEQCLKYPLAYLQYLRISAMSGDAGARARCAESLRQMQAFVQASGLNEGYQNFLLGEINVVSTFVVFNDLEAMAALNRKAVSLFSGGCSCIVTRRKEFTFGSPHLLYLYYREKGALHRTADFLAAESDTLVASIDGCGTGCDSVALAEYALETGALADVELHAYKALYKAKYANQTCLMICAKFALARLNIMQGRSDKNIALLDSLRTEVLRENNPVLNSTYDLCIAYLSACMGQADEIPEWVRTGDSSAASFLYQSRSFFEIAHGKAALACGDYIKLDALCEASVRSFVPFQNQLGFLHNAIHQAVAKKHLLGMDAACDSLARALEIGEADNIILPFAENAVHILDLLEEARRRGLCRSGYLDRVTARCREYRDRLDSLAVGSVALTAREKEILQLLEQGQKHEEIGGRLFISVTTVRYHIKNIYQKLGVNNKVLAIKKAQEKGLI